MNKHCDRVFFRRPNGAMLKINVLSYFRSKQYSFFFILEHIFNKQWSDTVLSSSFFLMLQVDVCT